MNRPNLKKESASLLLDISDYAKYVRCIMTKKKIKMGRPPKRIADRRSTITTIRLKPEDRKQLESDATVMNMSLSDYLFWCWQKARG